MKCELPQQDVSHESMGMAHAMSDMPHEMGVMSTETDASDHNSDCCNTMEHCVSGSCLLPALGHHLFSLTPILATTAADDVYDRKFSVQPVSSLYRPPIFR